MNTIVKTLTVLILLVTLNPISQDLNAQMLADFETPETSPVITSEGATYVVENPDKTGINPSDSVGYYHKIDGNWHYVSLHFPDTVKIRYSNTLTFKLRATTQGRIFAKFYNGSDVVIEHWAPEWNFQPSANRWVECTMDMTKAMGKQFTMLQLAACVDNTTEADVWFDDVKLSNPDAGDGTPVLDYTISDRNIVPGEEITLDASGSYDFDGDIVEYSWDFGDGNTGTGPVVNHSYASDSLYEVRITITDNDGMSTSESEMVFVIHPDHGVSQPLFNTSEPKTNRKIEAIFQVMGQYINEFDPDEVMVNAVISFPGGDSAIVPCFFYLPMDYLNENWVPDPYHQSWMLRFMTEMEGEHQVRFVLVNADGTRISKSSSVEVTSGSSPGPIREDTANRQYFRHTTGEPFYPLGINIGWNSLENYTQILNNLSDGRANTFRYWQTPFAWQALEWSEDYYYNYEGLGRYNQEAAAMSDSLLELCSAMDMYMQLAIFQHGPFSENVNEMWDTNPYNSANGGFVDRAEEFFYNESCKQQTKKLLRYLVARWSYSPNLFAWEFFNEVQFTGIHNSQTELWFPGVISWHSEMSRYIESIDPWDHLQTTSAADGQLPSFDTIQSLDNLQYHLYKEEPLLLNTQVSLDKQFLNDLENTSVINGEYGTRNEADTPFDMQRNAIWNGIMTQVPRYMWIWQHYVDPVWAGLFDMPARYLEDEDLSREEELNDYAFRVVHPHKNLSSLGLSGDRAFFGYIYDPDNGTSIASASVEIDDLPVANYNITYYHPVTGVVEHNDSIPLIKGNHIMDIPTFSKGLAFKVKYHSDYSLPLANAGRDTAVAVGNPATLSGSLSSSPDNDTLSYLWNLEEKPEGSLAGITGPSSMEIEITPDVAGIYRLSLVVNDGKGISEADEVLVRGSLPPIANAGPDSTVTITETYVRLNGSGSFDPDGDELFYSWILISAPEESEKLIYEEDAMEVILKTDAVGEFVLKLTVSDGISVSEPDTVIVTVLGDGTGLAPAISGPEFAIYPNPTSGKLLISPMGNDLIQRIEIIDLNGKILSQTDQQYTGTDAFEIDLHETVSAGQLLIIRITGNKNIEYQKVLFY